MVRHGVKFCLGCPLHQVRDTPAHGDENVEISKNPDTYVSVVTSALVEERQASLQDGRPPVGTGSGPKRPI